MAEYNVTGPDGSKYRVTGPDGATDEQVLSQVKAYKPPAAPAAAAAPKARGGVPVSSPGSDLDFISGNLNKGIANLAGLPVDTARNVANLGIAGRGVATGTTPDLLPPGPGSGEWFQNLMRRGGMLNRNAEPESSGGRYLAGALQAAPSAALGRPSIPQIPRALSAATTSAVGGEAAGDILGPEYAQAGALAAGGRSMAKSPGSSERATAERQAGRFGQAKDLGIPVPPRAMKPDAPQQKIQDALTSELKLPPGTELSADVLSNFRNQHYAEGYQPIITEPALQGKIQSTPAFKTAIKEIASEERKLRGEFPLSVKDAGLQKVLIDFTKPSYSTEGAMAQVKRLREGATRNLSSASATDDTMRLGLIQRRIANAMEDLIGENLVRVGKPELAENFKASRQAIAQSHDIENALDPVTGKVNPQKLAALQTEGKPISGGIKNVAQVTSAFPSAMKPMDDPAMFSSRMHPASILHPSAMAAHAATRWHDMPSITNSRPYQSFVVDPRSKLSPEQERFLRMMVAAQAGQRQQQGIPTPP